jgi:protein TonB
VGAPPPAPGAVAGEEIVAPPEPGNDADSPAVCLTDCGAGFVVDIGPAGTGDLAGEGLPPGGPVRAGIHVAPPRKLRDVRPVYPELARRVGAQGTVVIECRIDEAGRVVEARVAQSVPLLDAAALEAVEQWLYTPTLLNGVPVSVVMSVSVRFTLARP